MLSKISKIIELETLFLCGHSLATECVEVAGVFFLEFWRRIAYYKIHMSDRDPMRWVLLIKNRCVEG